jgi:hypothetical protein
MKKQTTAQDLVFYPRSFEKSAQAILNLNSHFIALEMSAQQQRFCCRNGEARTIVLEPGLEGKAIKPFFWSEQVEFIMAPYNLERRR